MQTISDYLKSDRNSNDVPKFSQMLPWNKKTTISEKQERRKSELTNSQQSKRKKGKKLAKKARRINRLRG